jgi:hypothetical protein
MKYKGTYYKGTQGKPTFSVDTTFTYDNAHLMTNYHRVTGYKTSWNNALSLPQQEVFEHTVTEATQQTWSNTVTTKVSSSVAVTVKAGIPAVCQEELTATVTAELGTSSTNAVSKTTTQTWKESQTLSVPAKTCITGCMVKKVGVITTVPYSITGMIKSAVTMDGHTFAGQCCYIRPGGAGYCGFLDDNKSTGGWNILFPPAYAASSSVKQCAGFGHAGTHATFTSAGKFSGGFGQEVDVATVKCGDKCIVPNAKAFAAASEGAKPEPTWQH